MKEGRSASQILLGFLPDQTVDLRGRVWRVKEWADPIPTSVEPSALRQELMQQVAPWARTNRDGGYLDHLRSGYRVHFYSLNREAGVRVEEFPKRWVCKSCDRLSQGEHPDRCACGSARFGQLPFVGFHGECGSLHEPYVRPCAQHKDIKITLPGTARAQEIRFSCPVCGKTLQKGFGFRKCTCGKGELTFNVHRAARVYIPRNFALINPPSGDKVQRIRDAGGAKRALSWVLGGLKEDSLDQFGVTSSSLIESLRRQGLAEDIIARMVEQAVAGGALDEGETLPALDGDNLVEAERGAVNIALALVESRLRIADMADAYGVVSEHGRKYHVDYPKALLDVGLEAVELVDRFPVATGCFGYSRDKFEPGASRLVHFKNRKGDYVVYGDVAKTEALLVRLDPRLVATWLLRSGCEIDPWSDQKSARVSILRAALIPRPGLLAGAPGAGERLLTLVHSYAHWLTRRLAVHSGVERSALSEFVVAQHCSFFVYASARGDFVLGGLQAVFETGLDLLLKDLASADLRCPLDPGCLTAGGACMACLHLGEPSCRYYNGFLSRRTLSGPAGYLSLITTD